MKKHLIGLGCWVKEVGQATDPEDGGNGAASIKEALKQGEITQEQAQKYKQINRLSNLARHQELVAELKSHGCWTGNAKESIEKALQQRRIGLEQSTVWKAIVGECEARD